MECLETNNLKCEEKNVPYPTTIPNDKRLFSSQGQVQGQDSHLTPFIFSLVLEVLSAERQEKERKGRYFGIKGT